MAKLSRDEAQRLRKAVIREHLHLDGLTRRERAEAIQRVADGFGVTPRTAREHVAAVRKGELVPPTRADHGELRTLPPDAVDYLRHLRRTSPIQSVRLLAEALFERSPDLSASYATIRRTAERIDREATGLEVRTPQPMEFRHPLDRWEVDISISDFFLFDPELDEDRPKRANLWCLLDCKTRCVAAACYSAYGDSSILGGLLYTAVLPKDRPDLWPVSGTPLEIMCDWGKVFVGGFGTEVLADLGIHQAKGWPYYPQGKGRVERWFGTCHRQLEDTLPGWCGPDNTGEESIDPTKTFRFDGRRWLDPRPCLGYAANRPLLTIAEANERLHWWIMERYHQTEHSELECSPLMAWQTGIMAVADRLHHLPLEVLEEVCLLQRAQRVVRRGQVRLKGLDYFEARLADYEGLPVEVRYAPEDCRAVSVYYDGRRICRAEAVGAIFIEQGEASFRKREEIAAAERDRLKRRRAIVKESTPHEAREIRRELELVAQQDAPDLLPVAKSKDPVPEWARGLTAAERRELEDIRVFGLPVVPGTAASPDEEPLSRAGGEH